MSAVRAENRPAASELFNGRGIKPIRAFWALLGICGPALCGLMPSTRSACALRQANHCTMCPRAAQRSPQGSAKGCCESYARLLAQSVDREQGVAWVAASTPAIVQGFFFDVPARPVQPSERPQELAPALYERDVGPNRARAPPIDGV